MLERYSNSICALANKNLLFVCKQIDAHGENLSLSRPEHMNWLIFRLKEFGLDRPLGKINNFLANGREYTTAEIVDGLKNELPERTVRRTRKAGVDDGETMKPRRGNLQQVKPLRVKILYTARLPLP